MQRWSRTVLDWTHSMKNLGYVVNIPKEDTNKNEYHKLYGIRAISLPDRRAKIEVDFLPHLNGSRTNGEYILDRFKGLEKMRWFRGAMAAPKISWGTTTWPPVIVQFELVRGKQFCDSAIALVREIFERLGIEEEFLMLRLTDFKLTSPDFACYKGRWITWERWVKIKNNLPLDADEEEENSLDQVGLEA